MDKYEVTNAEYLAFCEATDRRLPAFWGIDTLRSGPDFLNHPVIGVSWGDARAYARWRGARLPTEAEWEYAARGGSGETDYTLGDTFDHEVYATGQRGGPIPVGSLPANPFGLCDMTGNVCEWVNDWYDEDYYKSSPEENPRGPGAGWFKVIRGGGWHTGPGCSRVYDRNGLKSNWLDFNVGFRCAKYEGESGASKMEEVIKESGIEAALAAYHDMKASKPGTYYFSEFEFNEMGYRLLGKEKIAEAVEVFKLNVEAFPDSPNAYDSLGEAYMTQGNREQAILNYKKSIELNPGNQGGRDALEKLEEE
jgi:iron(II)-dependent oxidoreductase